MNAAVTAAVARRAGLRCEYCHAPAAIFNFGHEIDHVIPVCKGGTDDLGNLALACRACDSYKQDFQVGLNETTGEEVALFHPRREQWAAHFAVNSDGMLLGLTATGRATIVRLRLNTPVQVSACHQWMLLGLWP